MRYVEGIDRHQLMMASLDQFVHPEAFCRIIDAFVDAIDMASFEFKNAKLNSEGRPPYPPGDLLKMYIYGYQYGIRSCRKLEHAAKVNIEVMWLLKGKQPHYRTIAKFRKDNRIAFTNVFRQFLVILKDWDLIEGKTIAVDSFKIRAQNSLKKNFNKRKLGRHLDYIDNKINEYLEAFENTDDEVERAELKKKLEKQANKQNEYEAIADQLDKSDEEQISLTDPDARAVIMEKIQSISHTIFRQQATKSIS